METTLFDLPLVRELLSAPPSGTHPVSTTRNEVTVVSYSSTRLTFRRDAVRTLPPRGILLIRVRPRSGDPYDVAMTREDFEANFANIVKSRSWIERGIYDCSNPPPRVRPFVRPVSTDDIGREARAGEGATSQTVGASRDKSWVTTR